MAKQLTDNELNIRRKARRRLIGAVALTLAVVVILPMVLDSEPKPAEPDIDLHIPDPDKVSEFVSSVTIPEDSMLPPPSDQPVLTDVSAAPATSGNESVSANKSENTSRSKTQATANMTPKPKAPDKPAIVADGYVAQTGAYSNADTAKQELGKLKKWGFKAYTEKSGDMIRVRVGPYSNREKAEKVGKMLEKHGMQPVILSAK